MFKRVMSWCALLSGATCAAALGGCTDITSLLQQVIGTVTGT